MTKQILIFEDVLRAVQATQGLKRIKVDYYPSEDSVWVYTDADITYDFGKSYVHPSMIKHDIDDDFEAQELMDARNDEERSYAPQA